LTAGYGLLALSKPLELWINDGLMAIFFFLVGLEIKREAMVGDLASPKRAALPIAGALGGMIVPALLYSLWNFGEPASSGWGVPMATDIAFALGILALLGNRVPSGLRIFLAALAIVDDLGAVLVIAIFYTTEISLASLMAAAVVVGLLVTVNLTGVRSAIIWSLLGALLWLAFLKSGVHATIAGVVLAMTVPVRTIIDDREFVLNSRYLLDVFEGSGVPGPLKSERQMMALATLERAVEFAQAPLQRFEHALHPWVAFVIMPVFALANAGVVLDKAGFVMLAQPLSIGVITGLVIGKPIGITLFAWLAVASGLGQLPTGATWKSLHGVAWLGGIGFTMALFIAGLAFSDPQMLRAAKMSILVASTAAGIIGSIILIAVLKPRKEAEPEDAEAPKLSATN
jgi:NhaA family Na+:H+ antiporter